MYRIAVASSDGVTINAHFGQAGEFLIYAVDDGGAFNLLEKRRIASPDEAGKPHQHGAKSVADQLADVDVVLVNQIGLGAIEALQEKGIKSFVLKGPIDKALTAYGKRGKLFGTTVLGLQTPQPRGDGSRRCARGGE